MASSVDLTKILDELKSPRQYIRYKAVNALMAIRDDGAITSLFKLIPHESDTVKIHFVRLLGRVRGDVAVPPLIVLLLDKSEKVAREASIALDGIDNDRRTEALMLLLRRGNDYSKKYALKSLGSTRKIKAVSSIVQVLNYKDDALRELAIDALRQIRDLSAIQSLQKLLRDKDERIVCSVILTLGEIGSASTAQDLTVFLKHRNPEIRKSTVWALDRLGHRKAFPDFCRMLSEDPSEAVREEICKRLGRVGGGDAVEALLHARVFDKSHNVRVYAEWALSDIPTRVRESPLLRMVKSTDESLRGQAYLELGRTGDPKYLKVLNEAIKMEKSELTCSMIREGVSILRRQPEESRS